MFNDKELMHNPIFLSGKSEVATKEDLPFSQDLLDTPIAHKDSCASMAANMIGVRKQIIVFDNEGTYMIMLTQRLSKSQGRMIPKKVVFLYSAILANANAIRPSKFSGKPQDFKTESKPSLAGQRKSPSIKSIIAIAC